MKCCFCQNCTTVLQFATKDEADRCLAAAIGATDPAHARDTGGSCIYLGSRALHVTRAVDREEVRYILYIYFLM